LSCAVYCQVEVVRQRVEGCPVLYIVRWRLWSSEEWSRRWWCFCRQSNFSSVL